MKNFPTSSLKTSLFTLSFVLAGCVNNVVLDTKSTIMSKLWTWFVPEKYCNINTSDLLPSNTSKKVIIDIALDFFNKRSVEIFSLSSSPYDGSSYFYWWNYFVDDKWFNLCLDDWSYIFAWFTWDWWMSIKSWFNDNKNLHYYEPLIKDLHSFLIDDALKKTKNK